MGKIKGMPVILHVRTQTGTDALNNPVYAVTTVTVDNVLVAQPSSDDITGSIDLYGKKLDYMLGIPKGDTHEWEDTTVEFLGETFQTFGALIQGIEANVPGPWHKKIRVARYE